MTTPRIIKRYANRKLYDTKGSVYVTLEQIAGMVRAGDDLKIIDNTSKEDLTSVTLAQIIFEEEKRKRLLPLTALKRIIQTGGESISDFVSQIGKDLDQKVGRVFRKSPDEKGDGAEPEPSASELAEESGEAREQRRKSLEMFREWLHSSQKTFEEWQAKVDEEIRKMFDSVSPLSPLQKDVQGLAQKMDALERRLARLEGK